jgi:serine/threonine protein kinase
LRPLVPAAENGRVPTRISAALTRTATAQRPTDHARARARDDLLAIGQVVTSPETRLEYRIERLLGQGGFGQVYLAERLGRSTLVPDTVCIKVSRHIDAWLREAYFGRLLDGHARAIRVFDVFPLMMSAVAVDPKERRQGVPVDPKERRQGVPVDGVLYCLALEYARHGDLSAFLRRDSRGWTESVTRREIAGILEVLGKLHRGQLLHRDLTPLNVFVCETRHLKLGDFGIVRQQSDRRGITARTMNALTAPSEMLSRVAPKWQARDDVYQVGQLLAMLTKGDASTRIRTSDIRTLPCSDHLKEIIHRCIGERRKRYENANELIEALRNPPASLRAGVLRSLKGVHLTFTGILRTRRSDAAAAARRAGAIVHSGPSSHTTVVVRGRPNPLQAAGRDGGLKLMEIKRLREKGHRITLLNEAHFWRLVQRRP